MVFYWRCESYLRAKASCIVNSIKITRFGFVFGKISRGFVFVSVVSFSIIYLCALCGCYYFQKLMFAATPLSNLLLNKVHW